MAIPAHLRCRVPSDDSAPLHARAQVARVLAGFPATLLNDVQLVASELVTNALRHGGGVRWFGADPDEGVVQVAVADLSAKVPAIARHATEGGFGLRIVDRLSDEWGFEPDAAGKVVWSVIGEGRAGDEPSESG